MKKMLMKKNGNVKNGHEKMVMKNGHEKMKK